jgi:GntR family transcriptional regulator, arabinose operon transcriptional repressor
MVKNIISSVSNLAGQIREHIRQEGYAVGQGLPTERVLAQRYGVSRGTIRQALDILEQQRLVIRHQGRGTFVADPVYTRLQSNQATLIGMLVYEREYYFERIIQAASTQAAQRGYALATGLNGTQELEAEHIKAFIKNYVQGVIMTPRRAGSQESYNLLVEKKIPVVFIDNLLPRCQEDYVVVDNRLGTFLAVEHLAGLGHSRIAYSGHNVPGDIPCQAERRRGYREGCREFQLSVREDWVIEADKQEAAARIARILEAPDRPTAFVCYNDYWATVVVKSARQMGLEVPRDLSVTGFDDSKLATDFDLPLTTLNPEYRDLGIAGVEMMIDKIDHPELRAKRGIFITPRLVVRDSTMTVSKNTHKKAKR